MSMIRFIITGVAGVGIVSAGAYALDQTTRDESGAIVQEGELGVFSFTTGDCVSNLDMGGGNVEKATGVPCSQSHQAEVYAESFFEDNSESISSGFFDQVDEYCYSRFAPFTGISYESSALEFYILYPSADSWKDGDREVTCLIYDPAGSVNGTLRNSQR
jgi:hypothetical protein